MNTRVLMSAALIGCLCVVGGAPLTSEAHRGAWRVGHEVRIEEKLQQQVRSVGERIEYVRHEVARLFDTAHERKRHVTDRFVGRWGMPDDAAHEEEQSHDAEDSAGGSDGLDEGEAQEDDESTEGGEDESAETDETDVEEGSGSDEGNGGEDEGVEDSSDETGDEGGETSEGDAQESEDDPEDAAGDAGSGEEGGATDTDTGSDPADGDTGGGSPADESPTPSVVRITEVLFDPGPTAIQGTDNENEWIELYNAGTETVDLAGWSIGDGTASDSLGTDELLLPAGEYLIITRAASTDTYWVYGPGTVVVHLNATLGSGGLTNTGESVILYDSTDAVVDAVSWGVASANAPALMMDPSVDIAALAEGESIARIDPNVDTDAAADWVVRATPTPGA